MPLAPGAQFAQDRAEVAAGRGELVLVPGRPGPLGALAGAILAARPEAPDTAPFVPGRHPQPLGQG